MTGAVKVKTRVFELYNGTLSELARGMGISVSQIYRVREGKRNINERFIIGGQVRGNSGQQARW